MVKPIDLVLNSRVVAGFHLTHVKTRLPERYRDALIHLFELYRQNVIRPRIDSTWTFYQVKHLKKMGFEFYISNLHFIQVIEATKRLSERENIGKVILTP
jgi:hypothetical protein